MRSAILYDDWVILILIGLGIGFFAVHAAGDRTLAFVVLGPLLIALVVWFALTRFELFTLLMIATRTSIELIPLSPSNELLRLSVLATGTYTVAGIVWLVRSGGSHRFRPSPLAWTVIGVVVAGSISTVLSPDPLQAGMGASRWLFLAVFVLVIERLVEQDSHRFAHRALLAFAGSMVVPLVLGALQILSDTPSVLVGATRISGSLSHPNTFGFYLVILILVLLAIAPKLPRAAKAGTYLVAGFAALELAATYSRTSYLALGAGVLVLILVGHRWFLLGVTIAAIAVATLIPGVSQRWADLDQDLTPRGTPGNSLAWRMDYWGTVLDASEGRRVTGLGLGVVSQTTEQEREPHNDFVRALAELGGIGLLAYVALLAALVLRASSGVRRPSPPHLSSRDLALGLAAVTGAYLVGSVTGNLMTQLVLLWYVLGLAALARPGIETSQIGGLGRAHA